MTVLRSVTHFMTATGVKAISGLIVIKLMASELGPEGFGLLGQLMTVVAVTAMLAGGSIANGVIRSLASAPCKTAEGKRWLSAAFTVTTIVSAAVALVCIAFAQPLSGLLLKGNYPHLFIYLAVVQAVIAYGNLIQAEASSRGDSAFYAKVNILGTLLATGVLVVLVKNYGFEGAATGLVLMPALPGLVALHHVLRHRRDLLNGWNWRPDRQRIQRLLSFSTATVIGATSIPLAHLFIRETMGSNLGWGAVGYWQGVVKISDVYMQFVGVVLINHAMPRFAAALDGSQALRELAKVMILLMGIVTTGLAVLYVLRDWTTKLVFSDAFLPMTDLFPAQLAGDMLRTTAATISFFFMGRGQVALSTGYELLQGPIMIVLFLLLQDAAGVHAPVYAHLTSNAVLASTMGIILLIWFRRGVR